MQLQHPPTHEKLCQNTSTGNTILHPALSSLAKVSIGIENDSKLIKEVAIVLVTNVFPSQGGLAVAAMNVRHCMETSQQDPFFRPTTRYVHTI